MELSLLLDSLLILIYFQIKENQTWFNRVTPGNQNQTQAIVTANYSDPHLGLVKKKTLSIYLFLEDTFGEVLL